MSRTARILTFILVIVVLAGAVTGIAYWSANQTEGAPQPGFYQNGRRVENPEYLLKMGEQEVPFSVYRHYFLLYKSYFEMYYGAGMYENDPDGDNTLILKQSVEEQIQHMAVWQEIARREGVSLNDEDMAEMMETLDQQKADHGDGFDAYLSEMFYLDEANYLEVTSMQKLVDKTKQQLQSQLEEEYAATLGAEADAEYEDSYLSAKHILINLDYGLQADENGETPEPTEEQKQAAILAAEAEAETLYQQIITSDDPAATFDALMGEHSDDPGLASNPDGYTFTQGEMVDIFYETALQLEEGAIAPPVLADEPHYQGFHVIMRIPLNEEAKATNRDTAVAAKVDEEIKALEDEVKAENPVGYGPLYDNFTAADIK